MPSRGGSRANAGRPKEWYLVQSKDDLINITIPREILDEVRNFAKKLDREKSLEKEQKA